MKVDLKKAFDYLDWGYLRLVLHKIGIQPPAIDWIMACVKTVQFVVIINGYPISYFKRVGSLGKDVCYHPSYSYLLWMV